MDQGSLSLESMSEILNAEQIAKYLSISYVKALHTIKYGGIPHKKIGNTYRIVKNQFIAWLNNN